MNFKEHLDKAIHHNLGETLLSNYKEIIINTFYFDYFIEELFLTNIAINSIAFWEFRESKPTKSNKENQIHESNFFDGKYYKTSIPAKIINDPNMPIKENLSIYRNYINETLNCNDFEYTFSPSLSLNTPKDWIFEYDIFLISKYKKIFKKINLLINEWDPIGLIAMHSPQDEYDIEINFFLPRMIHSPNNNAIEIFNYTFKKFFGESYNQSLTSEKRIVAEVLEIIKNER
ncbi:hypothetical protein NUH30_15485 [Leptospira sp. 85282-16]|uniref:hypothetical protein n=1 Tax=Leptospira sp. 85282-16 TaxID=2971256 RepID=UPI0021C0A31D|nr:hypothetical protein [Leptospira sp. 85282-16]MCT8335081.1 hypothetical protein [Leptospira sp. 85282-16]